MKKIMIIAGLGESLLLFRQELMQSWQDKGFSVVAAAPEEKVQPALKERGIAFRPIPLSRTGLNPLQDLYLLFKLWRLIRSEKPASLFLYTIKPVIYGSLAALCDRRLQVFSLITGLGYVYTSEKGNTRLLQRVVSGLYRLALRSNKKVFFQNPDDLKFFTTRKIIAAEKAVLINGSGVNLDYFYPRPLPKGPPVFLLIARLLKEKGIYEYLEAAGRIKQSYPQASFKLLGWAFGDNPSAIKPDDVERWRQAGIVEVYDAVEDVRPLLETASVYVLPSYREGTPRTVLEAMAMGRPIITSDAPGCRETVEEGVNGFLVPVGNALALQQAMEKFIAEPQLAEKMGKESRIIVEQKYDVHQVNLIINSTMGL